MEEGNSACWERDLKKRHPVLTSLIPSQTGSGVAILTQICFVCHFVGLGFSMDTCNISFITLHVKDGLGF